MKLAIISDGQHCPVLETKSLFLFCSLLWEVRRERIEKEISVCPFPPFPRKHTSLPPSLHQLSTLHSSPFNPSSVSPKALSNVKVVCCKPIPASPHGPGVCSLILTVASLLLIGVTLPFSLIFCLKVLAIIDIHLDQEHLHHFRLFKNMREL